MLKERVISACVIVPVVVAAAYFGGIVFLALVMVICGIAAWEFVHIFDQHDGIRMPYVLPVVCVLLLIIARYVLGVDASHRTLTLCIMAAMLCSTILCEKEVPKSALSFVVMTTDMVYIGWLGGYFISLRQLSDGFVKFTLVMLLVWISDVGAYAIGKPFGKHRMFKVVSPNKTWEGFFGGICFTIGIGALAQAIVPPVSAILNMKEVLILSAAIAISAPLGDLGESMIKRCYGIKDSSHLIPGHGGFLDRFDSCFFAMPIAYYFFELIHYL